MKIESTRKILTRDFIFCFFAQSSFSIAYHILLPTLPIYLLRLGAKEGEIGVLIGIFGILSLLFRPLVGRLLLKISERTLMGAGTFLFALSSIIYLFAAPFWPFLTVRGVQGIGFAFFRTASFTLIANITPMAYRGQSLGYFLLAPNISLALAPSLGMFLINHFGFTVLFLTCTGLSLCSLLITSVLGKREVAPLEDAASEDGFFISRKALPPSLVSFFTRLIWGALMAFFPLYALRHGVGNPGFFFSAIAVMLISGRALGGKIIDLYDRGRVILTFLIVHVVAMSILTFSRTLPMFILVGLLWGTGSAFLTPAVWAYTLDRVGSSRGPVIGTLTAISDLGVALGPVVMGFIIRLTSYQAMLTCLVLTSAVNVIYFSFLMRKKDKGTV